MLDFVQMSETDGSHIQRRTAVIVDVLTVLRSMYYSAQTDGPPTIEVNSSLILSLENMITRHFSNTDLVCIVCDQDEHVPVTKGHTQNSRSTSAGLLPEYELRLPGNTSLVPAHQLALWKQQQREEQEAATRSRFSFVNKDSIDVTCKKLGVDFEAFKTRPLIEQLALILDASASHPLPDPWEFAVDSRSGNRQHTLSYIVSMMCFSTMYAYTPPRGAQLVFDGHYCTYSNFPHEVLLPDDDRPLTDRPLVLSSAETQEPVVIARPLSTKPSRPLVSTAVALPCFGKKGIELDNQLGEADHKIFAIIHKLHMAFLSQSDALATQLDSMDLPYDPPCYEIVSCDTDIFLQSLWFLTQYRYLSSKYKPPTDSQVVRLPRIVIRGRGKSSDKDARFCDMLEIFLALDRRLNPDTSARSDKDKGCAILSYLAVGFAYGSDYTLGFSNITADTMYKAYNTHGSYIGELVAVQCDNEEFPHISVRAEAYLRLVLASYYVKYQPALTKRGVIDVGMMNVKVARAFTEASQGAKWSKLIANPTMPLPEFKSMMAAMAKRFPTDEHLLGRFMLLQYYITLVSQVGQSQLLLPDPLCSGYEKIDGNKSCVASNIRFVASSDYYGLASKREQLLSTAK